MEECARLGGQECPPSLDARAENDAHCPRQRPRRRDTPVLHRDRVQLQFAETGFLSAIQAQAIQPSSETPERIAVTSKQRSFELVMQRLERHESPTWERQRIQAAKSLSQNPPLTSPPQASSARRNRLGWIARFRCGLRNPLRSPALLRP